MKIRLWKLGSLDHKILPSKDALKELTEKVKNLTFDEHGCADIVWGPDLELQVFDVTNNDTDFLEE